APRPADAAWWRVLDDPLLDALVQRANSNNTDLAVAAARLAQARATLGSTLSRSQPQLNASASAGRQGGPLLNDVGSSGNLFSAGLQLAYEVDLSGALASSAQAAQLDLQARDSLMRSARLMVQADRRRAELAHALAVLLGEVASQFRLAELADWSPHVPTVPSGLPSDMLQRRADVAAAVQQFQAAQARTTSAQQAWWPSLALTASGGQASPTLADLLKSSTR
ncbi:MAG: RND transporter, partial [Burkholderiales bacterium PBB5]